MGVYKHPRPLYTLKKQNFIYSLVRVLIGVNMNQTRNYTEFEQPLFKCEECKNEFTVTYPLFKSELCWDCYQEFNA